MNRVLMLNPRPPLLTISGEAPNKHKKHAKRLARLTALRVRRLVQDAGSECRGGRVNAREHTYTLL